MSSFNWRNRQDNSGGNGPQGQSAGNATHNSNHRGSGRGGNFNNNHSSYRGQRNSGHNDHPHSHNQQQGSFRRGQNDHQGGSFRRGPSDRFRGDSHRSFQSQGGASNRDIRKPSVFERDWSQQKNVTFKLDHRFMNCEAVETIQHEGTLVKLAEGAFGLIEKLEFAKGKRMDSVRVERVTEAGLPIVVWEMPDPVDFKAPLIVLDLNGVLVGRPSFKDRKRFGHGAPIMKRKYCDDFIRFCFENFNVAVWSCGKRQNMEMELFEPYMDRLVFQWDQEHSTNLWPRTSIVSKEKPLFLKELSKVWETYRDRFDEANTILLDNHSEKFERNPFHTGILIPEFTFQQGNTDQSDLFLDPEGDLFKSLRTYVDSCKAGEPLEERKVILGSAQGPLLRETFASVFTSSAVMQANCPDRDVKFYMKHRDIPGPRAFPFRRQRFEEIKKTHTSWVVCEKSNGVRHMLLSFPGPSGHCFLVNRSWTFTEIGQSSFPNDKGFTMLDGELVTSEDGTKQAFLVFDVVWLNGEDVGAMQNLTDRMEQWKQFSNHENNDVKIGELSLITKRFHPLGEIEQLKDAAKVYEYDVVGRVDCDGLVFTPTFFSYYEYTVIKFKPISDLTVDLRLNGQDLFARSFNRADAPFQVTGKHRKEFLSLVQGRITDELYNELLTCKNQDYFILECRFLHEVGQWEAFHVRKDKVNPNSLSIAWTVLESIAENVSTESLVQELGAHIAQHPEPESVFKAKEVNDVAKHYNERQQQRNQNAALDGRIENLRKLNNWSKAVLIHEACTGKLEYRGEIGLDDASGAEIPRVLTLKKPRQPSGRFHQAKRPVPMRVLDLACGRGGDLQKWKHGSVKIENYVGVDVASVALEEARERAGDKNKFHFLEYDMSDETLLDHPEMKHAIFDIISVQFAFHYICGDANKVKSFFKICQAKLKDVGDEYDPLILISTTDEQMLRQRAPKFSNEVCAVEFKTDSEPNFGTAYSFSLGDAVQECDEFLVPLRKVSDIAKKHGFELVLAQNLASFVQDKCSHYEPMLHSMSVIGAKTGNREPISMDEWEAIQLYRIVVFKKVQQ